MKKREPRSTFKSSWGKTRFIKFNQKGAVFFSGTMRDSKMFDLEEDLNDVESDTFSFSKEEETQSSQEE